MAKESRQLTVFTVPSRGLFPFKRMSFNLSNAPVVWQRLIDQLVGVDLEQFVFVYFKDKIICIYLYNRKSKEHVLSDALSRSVPVIDAVEYTSELMNTSSHA